MTACLACLMPGADLAGYHPDCLKHLFCVPRLPLLEVETAQLPELISDQAADKISISGIQPKLMMDLSEDRTRLQPRTHGRYILKPQVIKYRHLPENEHLTMCLARLVGIPVPALGLLRLADGSFAYLVKRFDRTDDEPPQKHRQEDFCALTGRDPTAKYDAPLEACAQIILRYSIVPGDDARRFFLQSAFAYWTSNGDMHLKNLSLFDDTGQGYRLTPAYDLICTRLYSDDQLALHVNNKRTDLKWRDWMQFAEHCGIPAPDAATILGSLLQHQSNAEEMVRRSLLPENDQRSYIHYLEKRTRAMRHPPAT